MPIVTDAEMLKDPEKSKKYNFMFLGGMSPSFNLSYLSTSYLIYYFLYLFIFVVMLCYVMLFYFILFYLFLMLQV